MSSLSREFQIVLKNLLSPAQPLISLAQNKHLKASSLSSVKALIQILIISTSDIFLAAHARKNISTTLCREVELVSAQLLVRASSCLVESISLALPVVLVTFVLGVTVPVGLFQSILIYFYSTQ